MVDAPVATEGAVPIAHVASVVVTGVPVGGSVSPVESSTVISDTVRFRLVNDTMNFDTSQGIGRRRRHCKVKSIDSDPKTLEIQKLGFNPKSKIRK